MHNLFAGTNTYDPLKVDLSEINAVCSKIPRDGHIDINVAEELATTFLQCADQITDMICQCAAYTGKIEGLKQSAKADAIDSRITGVGGKGVAATVAVQLYASDPAYQLANNNYQIAEAFLEWLRTKYKNLMAAHVLCKDVMKIHFDSQNKGRRTSANPHDLDEEGEEGQPSKAGADTWG